MTKTDLAIDLFIGLNEGVITTDEYTEMIYSGQLGLGYRFDNSMTLSVIWKLLGQSTKDRFDNFLFHSAGLRLGYDF